MATREPDGTEDAPVGFPDAASLEAWLEAHHASAPELWLLLPKKGCPEPSVTHRETLDLMLCFGWIDAIRKTWDEHFFRQRYTPRRARSRWSQVNVARVGELTEAGLMRPSGLAEVERARADGRWAAAYAPPSRATVPDDLQAALNANPAAAAFFLTLSSQNRFAILYRVGDAKRAETRARRIANFVADLAAGRTIY
ncbi:YdeI family protein [Spongisporangium articulatum]|uniref:YdeI family protein n=1 Tax=Spongisporangium articulatum TaxID=3362603 RepID=A0ABW8AN50_9ACTN